MKPESGETFSAGLVELRFHTDANSQVIRSDLAHFGSCFWLNNLSLEIIFPKVPAGCRGTTCYQWSDDMKQLLQAASELQAVAKSAHVRCDELIPQSPIQPAEPPGWVELRIHE